MHGIANICFASRRGRLVGVPQWEWGSPTLTERSTKMRLSIDELPPKFDCGQSMYKLRYFTRFTFGAERFTISSPPKKERRLFGRRTTSIMEVAATSWTNETTTFATFLAPFDVSSRRQFDGSSILAVAREDLGERAKRTGSVFHAGDPRKYSTS